MKKRILPVGSALEHGSAHTCDHLSKSRRSFLQQMGLAALGAPFVMGAARVSSFGPVAPRHWFPPNPDRILVLVRLNGGNDGLSTVVPYTNDVYYQNRSTVGIDPGTVIQIDDDFGLHPNLERIRPLYDAGRMSITQGVGYPGQNLSHFISMDHWESAGTAVSDFSANTGWMGRHLNEEYPDFKLSPPDEPLAIEFGPATSLTYAGPEVTMAMALRDPDEFNRIALTGFRYDPADVPDTERGEELSFLRTIANASDLYAGVIKAASDAGENVVDYEQGTYGFFPESLEVIARLIKGGLTTQLYTVELVGFDTHFNQPARHGELMTELAEGIRDFFDDLDASDDAKRVTLMTYSEFGRRLEENGSDGTDHGSCAPVMLFGDNIVPGFHGQFEDLVNLDDDDNPVATTDYRSVYATVMEDWLGATPAQADSALVGNYPRLGLFNTRPPVEVSARVRVQGAVTGSGDMKTDLQDQGLLPLSHPFSGAPFNYNGPETVVSMPADVVDWVMIELNPSGGGNRYRRAALLRSDGTVVDTDGVSAVSHRNVPAGTYSIIVRQRNHLAVEGGSVVVAE